MISFSEGALTALFKVVGLVKRSEYNSFTVFRLNLIGVGVKVKGNPVPSDWFRPDWLMNEDVLCGGHL